jgi:hypothetical protein
MAEERQRHDPQSMPAPVDGYEKLPRKHRYLADRMGRFSGIVDALLYPQLWLSLIAVCFRAVGRLLKAFAN